MISSTVGAAKLTVVTVCSFVTSTSSNPSFKLYLYVNTTLYVVLFNNSSNVFDNIVAVETNVLFWNNSTETKVPILSVSFSTTV